MRISPPIGDEDIIRRIYNVLVEVCGAGKSDEDSFIYRHQEGCHEFRFIGALGFGGKFYNAGKSFDGKSPWRVDCYQEDLTPKRQEVIEKANHLLGLLWKEYDAAPNPEHQDALREIEELAKLPDEVVERWELVTPLGVIQVDIVRRLLPDGGKRERGGYHYRPYSMQMVTDHSDGSVSRERVPLEYKTIGHFPHVEGARHFGLRHSAPLNYKGRKDWKQLPL